MISKQEKVLILNLKYFLDLVNIFDEQKIWFVEIISRRCLKIAAFAQIFPIASRKILFSRKYFNVAARKKSDFTQIFETWESNGLFAPRK